MTTDYVPDPERDISALLRGFFDHVAVTLAENSLPATHLADIQQRHRELDAADAARVIDEPARYNLRMTLALVAAHEVLVPLLGRAESLAAVRDAFMRPLGAAVRDATKAMLDAAPDPFAALVAVSKAREEYQFGAGFTFERPVDDDRRYHVDVVRCFYYDVLAAHSATELAPVMCEFDTNWMDAVDPSAHGFRFDRVTTIGLGGSRCPFHFTRTDA
ncbi:L-2-amino-thiazoline-4-carboxylic acid hydrolase [Nocardia sp. NPDC052566]|uniref:L-2-amino-thiazoline-4-carboxylic acid hydrolase n=1 Tax=Nocardia sp. NPDC052566 TaxID=3364330 RepID=UPI0037C841EB